MSLVRPPSLDKNNLPAQRRRGEEGKVLWPRSCPFMVSMETERADNWGSAVNHSKTDEWPTQNLWTRNIWWDKTSLNTPGKLKLEISGVKWPHCTQRHTHTHNDSISLPHSRFRITTKYSAGSWWHEQTNCIYLYLYLFLRMSSGKILQAS